MRFSVAAILGLAALPLLAGAAQADSREQVMLRLPRCSNLAEQRPYLDCYYAAVQPLRGDLGLAAAPQSAAFFTGPPPAPPAGGIGQQALTVRENVLLRLTRCAAIGDTRQYLDCYYAAAQPLRAALGLQPAPQAVSYEPLFSLAQVAPAMENRPNLVPQSAYTQVMGNQVPPRLAGDEGATDLPIFGGILGIRSTRVPAEQFGLKNAKPGPGVNVDHIAAHITKVEHNSYTGQFTVTLDNGQVWKQVANDDAVAHWRKDMNGTVATIAYGAGQTFNLSVGENTLYKVERVS